MVFQCSLLPECLQNDLGKCVRWVLPLQAFCTGEKGKSKESGTDRAARAARDLSGDSSYMQLLDLSASSGVDSSQEMSYKNVPFHRIIKGFMMQVPECRIGEVGAVGEFFGPDSFFR